VKPDDAGQRLVKAHTVIAVPPLVPELRLHLLTEECLLWRAGEKEAAAAGLVDPYWAFAWPGGQALARHVLDHPEIVRGKRVLDLAAGSGLVAIAAARAGAAPVVAADIDPLAEAAIALNADANGVAVEIIIADLLSGPPPRAARYDVVLVGDLFYERDTAARALAFLEHHAAFGSRVLVGDPDRTYLPRERLTRECDYAVPVTRELEDQDIKRTSVWSLAA
jgi:predicted nicotinamide N-methyase